MSTVEMSCRCGWTIKTNDAALLIAASKGHNKTCSEPCPECVSGKHQNCTLTVIGVGDDEVPCPCVSMAHASTNEATP